LYELLFLYTHTSEGDIFFIVFEYPSIFIEIYKENETNVNTAAFFSNLDFAPLQNERQLFLYYIWRPWIASYYLTVTVSILFPSR
jgi:hypothetical protein